MTSRSLPALLTLIVLFASSARGEEDLSALSPLHFPAGADQVTIQCTRAATFLLAPVKVDDKDAGMMIIDTGANGVILERYNAQPLMLQQVGAGTVSAIGGTPTIETLAAKSVSLGGVAIDNTFVVSTDLASMRKESAIDSLGGLIGSTVLGRVPFTIDYRKATLTLYNPAKFKPPADAVETKLRVIRGMPAVQIGIEDESTAWFVVDTGSNGSLVMQHGYARLIADLLENKPGRPSLSVGAGGLHQHISVVLDWISFCGEHKSVKCSYSFEPGGTTNTAAAGAVGMKFFGNSQLTFDYANGRFWLKHTPDAIPAEWESDSFDPKIADAAGTTPLMRAAQLGRADFAKRFLAAGADANATDARGDTALIEASLFDRREIVAALLAAGAKVNAKTLEDQTALHAAAQNASPDLIDLLIQAGADIEVTDQFDRTALVMAAERGAVGVATALLEAGAKPDAMSRASGTPLHAAAFFGSPQVVAMLLKAGADANAVDPAHGKLTPLHVAAMVGAVEPARLLIAQHANLNAQTTLRQTPLMLAASKGQAAVVKVLLDAGADPELRDGDKHTALEIAAGTSKLEVTSQLFQRKRAAATQPATPATNPAQSSASPTASVSSPPVPTTEPTTQPTSVPATAD